MKIENQLCSDAHPSGRKFNPSACQTCISPCEPGKQWLRQMGMQVPDRRGEPLYGTAGIYPQGVAKMKMWINRR